MSFKKYKWLQYDTCHDHEVNRTLRLATDILHHEFNEKKVLRK